MKAIAVMTPQNMEHQKLRGVTKRVDDKQKTKGCWQTGLMDSIYQIEV